MAHVDLRHAFIENGAHTTNNPSGPTTPGGFNYIGLDCKKQLESGTSRSLRSSTSSAAIVCANAVFDRGGTVREIKLTNGETVDMGAFAGRALRSTSTRRGAGSRAVKRRALTKARRRGAR